MTDELTPEQDPGQDPGKLYIDFAAVETDTPRRMAVRTPTPEQLAVWQTNADRFTQMGANWNNRARALASMPPGHPEVVAFEKTRNQEATQALSRALKVVNSVLVEDTDRYWLEDQLMEGRLNLAGAFQIVTLTVEALRARRDTDSPAPRPKTRAKLAK
jgi:hypothetical protein